MSDEDSEGFFIRFHPKDARFPDICPVCSSPTDGSASVYLYQYDSDSLLPWLRSMSPDRIRIPTCQEHSFSNENIANRKVLRVFLIGVSILMGLYFIIRIGLFFFTNIPLNLWVFLIPALAIVPIALANEVAPIYELERAFLMLDYDGSTVTAKITNRAYAEEFLRLNPASRQVAKPMTGHH